MIEIKKDVLLSPLTSFRIGGKASYYVEVKDVQELKQSLIFAKEKNIKFGIIAGGTNMLVNDNGFDGIMIRLKMNEIRAEGNLILAEVGVPLIRVINFAAENCLTGMEKLAGVPGTIGGAVRGNAGAFGVEAGKFVNSITVLDYENLQIREIAKEECDFAYRSSCIRKNNKLVILAVKLELEISSKQECQAKVKEMMMDRMNKHKGVQGVKSAGLFFMNPKADHKPELLLEFEKDRGVAARNNVLPAAWVLEKAGLKGKKIGGAMISEENINYIINFDNAKAEDVVMLASYAKQQVRDKLGLQLKEEIEYVGF